MDDLFVLQVDADDRNGGTLIVDIGSFVYVEYEEVQCARKQCQVYIVQHVWVHGEGRSGVAKRCHRVRVLLYLLPVFFSLLNTCGYIGRGFRVRVWQSVALE